jgi:hypothetical protein
MAWLEEISVTWSSACYNRKVLLNLYTLISRGDAPEHRVMAMQELDASTLAELGQLVWSGFPISMDVDQWTAFTKSYSALIRQAISKRA